jgi:hypothetical protein
MLLARTEEQVRDTWLGAGRGSPAIYQQKVFRDCVWQECGKQNLWTKSLDTKPRRFLGQFCEAVCFLLATYSKMQEEEDRRKQCGLKMEVGHDNLGDSQLQRQQEKLRDSLSRKGTWRKGFACDATILWNLRKIKN